MFDIPIGKQATLAQKFVPVHPDPAIGTNHGVSLMLFGKHSPQYRDAAATMLKSRAKMAKDDGDLDVEAAVKLSAEFVADCCSGYEIGGKAATYDRDALAETLGLEEYRWLRIQAERYSNQDDNFFKKPAKK